MAEIQMPLLNSRTRRWRAVKVTPQVGALYRVEGQPAPGEEWAFKPGEVVSVKWQRFEDGQKKLVPSSARSSVILAQGALRVLSMLPPMAIILGAMALLPRDPTGLTQAKPMAIIGLLLALASLAGMLFWKPRSFAAKWMLRWGLGWGLFWAVYALSP